MSDVYFEWKLCSDGQEEPFLQIESNTEAWETIIDLSEVLSQYEKESADEVQKQLEFGVPFEKNEFKLFSWLLTEIGDEEAADVLACWQWLEPEEEVAAGTFKAAESYPVRTEVSIANQKLDALVLSAPEKGITQAIVLEELTADIGGFQTEFPDITKFAVKAI